MEQGLTLKVIVLVYHSVLIVMTSLSQNSLWQWCHKLFCDSDVITVTKQLVAFKELSENDVCKIIKNSAPVIKKVNPVRN